MTEEKIQTSLEENRIKLHLFEPSQRKVWTIVGQGEEHWIYPEMDYCSCPGFYFGQLNDKKECYHLKAIRIAQKENKFETITFSDEEFSSFISGVFSDL